MGKEIKQLIWMLCDYYESGRIRDINIPIIKNEDEKWLFKSLFNVVRNLKRRGIKSFDIHNGNLGLKPDGTLAMFDLGNSDLYDYFEEESVSIVLEEKRLLNKIKKIMGIGSSRYLGSGAYGSAHDIGDNKVLKITRDRSEASNCNKLVGKNNKYLSNIYDVRVFKTTNGETYYAIILEKLQRSSKLWFLYDRLEKTINSQVISSINRHMDISVLNDIKDKFIKVFLITMVKNGYEYAWEKYMDKINEYEKKYGLDFDDISDISFWIKGSKTNRNYGGVNVPIEVIRTLKKLKR